MNDGTEIKKNLNIAMVCDPISEYKSGVLVSTLRFAERLRNRGHKIIFIAAKSPFNPESDYLNGFRVYRFTSVLLPKSEGQWYVSFPSAKKIKKILQEEKIDVLHTLLPMPSSVVSMKAAKSLGIKIVAHSHSQPENLFMHMPKYFGREFFNKIYSKYLFWLYSKAHAVAYPSEFAKNLFREMKGNNIEHIVISNGVDTSEFEKKDSKNFFDKFKLSAEDKKILFVGRLHPEKCIETLIKSVPHIVKFQPNISVCIAGFGHQDKELKELTAKLGLSHKVNFLGRISEEDKVMAYNACDVFVLPSVAELEGMAVLEAMACGKPIVVANSPSSASTYFVDKNGLLFEPQNEKDLANKIVSVLSDENALIKMGEVSYEKSRQYDINESVLKLEGLYYSVLNK